MSSFDNRLQKTASTELNCDTGAAACHEGTMVSTMPHDLVDDAVLEVCAEYDKTGSIQTRAIIVMPDGEEKTIKLELAGGLSDFGTIAAQGEAAMEANGTREGFSIIYIFDQGHELVVVASRSDAGRALCILALNRVRGISFEDIHVVTSINDDDGNELRLFIPSYWTGPLCVLNTATISSPLKKITM